MVFITDFRKKTAPTVFFYGDKLNINISRFATSTLVLPSSLGPTLQVTFCVILLGFPFWPEEVSPEEDVEAEHGEHDGEVAQDADRIAQLVDQQEPLVDHPKEHKDVNH